VLDWGREGLIETMSALRDAQVRWAGAGHDAGEAAAPATLDLPTGGRLLVFALAASSSGVPPEWSATATRCGVNFIDAVSTSSAERVAQAIGLQRRHGDLVVVSIHWGGNWGFAIPQEHRDFARVLIESGAVDLVYGHSSHHVLGIEVIRGKLVLYGCGDFINDYEGIVGYESFGPNLALMYFPVLRAPSGELADLALVPLRRRRLRLEHADGGDVAWLARTLQREGERLGTGVHTDANGVIRLAWAARASCASR